MTGRNQGEGNRTVEPYGKHSQANARGLSVAALLTRTTQAGQAIRLAWRGDEAASLVDRTDEFPTAVLPVVRRVDGHQAESDGWPGDDQETEPATATREARRWLQPPGFSWWQWALAGWIQEIGGSRTCRPKGSLA